MYDLINDGKSNEPSVQGMKKDEEEYFFIIGDKEIPYENNEQNNIKDFISCTRKYLNNLPKLKRNRRNDDKIKSIKVYNIFFLLLNDFKNLSFL